MYNFDAAASPSQAARGPASPSAIPSVDSPRSCGGVVASYEFRLPVRVSTAQHSHLVARSLLWRQATAVDRDCWFPQPRKIVISFHVHIGCALETSTCATLPATCASISAAPPNPCQLCACLYRRRHQSYLTMLSCFSFKLAQANVRFPPRHADFKGFGLPT